GAAVVARKPSYGFQPGVQGQRRVLRAMQQQPFRAGRPALAQVLNGGQAKLPGGRRVHGRASQRDACPTWIELAEQFEGFAPDAGVSIATGALDNRMRGRLAAARQQLKRGKACGVWLRGILDERRCDK